MKKQKFSLFKSVKALFVFLFLLLMSVGLSGVIALKIQTPYRVSIYNYESYLSKPIINMLNKRYSYRVFGEINEFTRAIHQGKTVGGVGSDFQIANLTLKGKLKKINYDILFDDLPDKNNIESRKKIIESKFTPVVNEHIEKYQKWIIEQIKKINPENVVNNETTNFKPYLYYKSNKPKTDENIIGFEVDNIEGIDLFYEFLVPYFIQDKVVAFNVNKNYRKHINLFDLEKLKNDNWTNIYKTLKENGYKHFGWTNSFYDNLMLGQFYDIENKNGQFTKNGLEEINNSNIDSILNNMNQLIKECTGGTFTDSSINKLATNGFELVNDLIDPKPNKLDVALMYNGDVLDAFNSHDNFTQLKDGENIDYIKPKNNMLLIDAWIISKEVNDEDSNSLLHDLRDTVFDSINLSYEQLVTKYYENVLKLIKEKDKNIDSNQLKKQLFNEDHSIKSINEINDDFYSKNYNEFKTFDFLWTIQNFDILNYTTTFNGIYKFLNDYYFLNQNKSVNKKAMNIFQINKNKQINYQIYKPINDKTRTQIIEKYFESTHS
ncbi:hypothetical protein [Mycoplasma phocoenae]|uniref:Spermidine/putrescine transport system substrate-binding protein n=1 Tax=Mycoplasma phocoenae TaxID=754517 RepID=A0A858U6A5_9MOLU|nr:hypothetical protein [Mycoplasma phocoenae]QJG66795.1 hypothetical protein HGG69_00405 [Mycoplasma phocoenae]